MRWLYWVHSHQECPLVPFAPLCLNLLGLPEQRTTGRGALTANIYFLWRLEVCDQPVGMSGFSWDLSPWLWTPAILLCPPWLSSVCACIPRVSPSALISPFCKERSQVGLGPTLPSSFSLSHFFKGLTSEYRHILRYWTQGFNMWILWDTIQLITQMFTEIR